MSLDSREVEEFSAKLNYLGGRVSSKVEFDSSRYCDLEEFFLIGTEFSKNDERLLNCFEHWVRRFAGYLSPSKIRKYLDSGEVSFDPYVLRAMIEVTSLHHWKILLPYSKVHTPQVDLFGFKSQPKNPDKDWLVAGIVKTSFYPEFKKNIRPFEYFKKKCPELYWRLLGVSQPKADFKVIREKMPDLTLYAIAKRYKIDKSILYKEKQRLKELYIL